MLIEILTPDKTIFEGEAYGVQLPGIQGSFEILQNHAPMVAALGEGKMKVLKDKNGSVATTLQISGGFVETKQNKTMVLLEGAKEA